MRASPWLCAQTLSLMFEAMAAVCEEGNGERSEAQVALRYAIAKGCVPMPGVNTADHAREVAGALEWELDIGELESLSAQAKLLHARRRDLPWLRSL